MNFYAKIGLRCNLSRRQFWRENSNSKEEKFFFEFFKNLNLYAKIGPICNWKFGPQFQIQTGKKILFEFFKHLNFRTKIDTILAR